MGGCTPRIQSNIKGFTLIELAIVIIIIGVLIAGLLSTVKPIMHQSRLTATEANMNRVIDVIAAYVQRNNRVPCPADPDEATSGEPYGAEVGSGASGNGVGDCEDPAGGDLVEGVIPFRTLGLNLDDIRDGWGSFITYRVSPVFSRDMSASLDVHKRCRLEGLWTSGGTNRMPEKARFCCPDLGVSSATDVTIEDANGVTMWPFVRDPDAGAPTYAAANTVFPMGSSFDPADDNITQIAFVLVSHGANKYGAFLADGSRIGAGGAVGNGETENQNGDAAFVSAALNFREGSAAYFDDIVMWRTQDQAYAETGAGSCSFP